MSKLFRKYREPDSGARPLIKVIQFGELNQVTKHYSTAVVTEEGPDLLVTRDFTVNPWAKMSRSRLNRGWKCQRRRDRRRHVIIKDTRFFRVFGGARVNRKLKRKTTQVILKKTLHSLLRSLQGHSGSYRKVRPARRNTSSQSRTCFV